MAIVGVNGVASSSVITRGQLGPSSCFFGKPFLADEVICHPFSLRVVAELNLTSVRIARALLCQSYIFTQNKRGHIQM